MSKIKIIRRKAKVGEPSNFAGMCYEVVPHGKVFALHVEAINYSLGPPAEGGVNNICR